jgi:IS6 family transposase
MINAQRVFARYTLRGEHRPGTGLPASDRGADPRVPVTEQYANNPGEADHGRLKARLRPMRGLTRLRSARAISTGQAFVQNLRRGHYELGMDIDQRHRLPTIFTELARAI